MRVINRTAVTITGAKPCVDWTLKTDADANKGAITDIQERPEILPRMVQHRHPLRVVDVADDDIEGEEL